MTRRDTLQKFGTRRALVSRARAAEWTLDCLSSATTTASMLLARFARLPGNYTLLNAWQRPSFHSSAVWAKALKTFRLADIGEGITECEVIRWCVSDALCL